MRVVIPKLDRPMLVTESYPPTTGSDIQRQFAHMKARLVARYQLSTISGRPEELIRRGTSRGVSLGYGCRTIRLRLMDGREWVNTTDFQVSTDDRWRAELERICDDWFNQPAAHTHQVRRGAGSDPWYEAVPCTEVHDQPSAWERFGKGLAGG